MIGGLLRRFKAAIGFALAGVFLIFAAWRAGRRSAEQDAKTKSLTGYMETRKRIDEAVGGISDDEHVLRDWLRERGGKP